MVLYMDRKEAVRAELLSCARAGKTASYSAVGARVGIPPQGPWKPLLDVISREETGSGRPDITFVLIRKQTGLPGQNGFSRATPPTDAQKQFARVKLKSVFDTYCPGAPVPF